MIFSYQLWGAHVVCWFPGVIAFRVPLPLDQILEFTSLIAMGSDSFDFILHFAFDHVRRRPRVVLTVFFCFDVRRKE